jgi:hypothetical protein
MVRWHYTTNDFELFKQHTPPLDAGEKFLADKGYVGAALEHVLITPIKNKPRHRLTQASEEYNKIHSQLIQSLIYHYIHYSSSDAYFNF